MPRKFNRWTILRELEKRNYKRVFMCRCDCGTVKPVYLSSLKNGYSKSCGCLRREELSNNPHRLKHGHTLHPLYNTWSSMIHRCTSPKNEFYESYGGRGISVCERWQDFENFIADMGERPKGRTLDRIDNEGNYEPSNCRWATWSEQNKNRRF